MQKAERQGLNQTGKISQPLNQQIPAAEPTRLFNWINEKTHIQKAGKVRSADGLMLHCWGKLAVAFYLLVFNY